MTSRFYKLKGKTCALYHGRSSATQKTDRSNPCSWECHKRDRSPSTCAVALANVNSATERNKKEFISMCDFFCFAAKITWISCDLWFYHLWCMLFSICSEAWVRFDCQVAIMNWYDFGEELGPSPTPPPSFISGIASLGAHPEIYLMCSESEDKSIHSWPSTRSAGQIHYRTCLCSHSHKKHKWLLKNNILSYNLYTVWLKSSLTLESAVMQRMSRDFCAMLCYSLYLSLCWKFTKI